MSVPAPDARAIVEGVEWGRFWVGCAIAEGGNACACTGHCVEWHPIAEVEAGRSRLRDGEYHGFPEGGVMVEPDPTADPLYGKPKGRLP